MNKSIHSRNLSAPGSLNNSPNKSTPNSPRSPSPASKYPPSSPSSRFSLDRLADSTSNNNNNNNSNSNGSSGNTSKTFVSNLLSVFRGTRLRIKIFFLVILGVSLFFLNFSSYRPSYSTLKSPNSWLNHFQNKEAVVVPSEVTVDKSPTSPNLAPNHVQAKIPIIPQLNEKVGKIPAPVGVVKPEGVAKDLTDGYVSTNEGDVEKKPLTKEEIQRILLDNILPPSEPGNLFIQPRRAPRPAWPDPWSNVPDLYWKGRGYLSEKAFGANRFSGLVERPPPPSGHFLQAMNFIKNSRKGEGWDERTGRPLSVGHEEIFMGPKGRKPLRLKMKALVNGKGTRKMRKVQFQGDWSITAEKVQEERHRRDWVKKAFVHAWAGYKRHAWGHDELKPVSNGFTDSHNGWGATIFDSLDILLIMDLSDEYNRARAHVSTVDFTFLVPSSPQAFATLIPPVDSMFPPSSIRTIFDDLPPPIFNPGPSDNAVNTQSSPATIAVLPTVIRYLGGLLSAYDLSGDPIMLTRATELGDWILPALGTEHGLAMSDYVLGSNPEGNGTGKSNLAQVGSLSLEFTRLSMLTGNEIYFEAIQRTIDVLDSGFTSVEEAEEADKGKVSSRLGTLLPGHIDPSAPSSFIGDYSFSAESNSYYEYLLKQYQLLSDANPQYGRMYAEAIDSAVEHLVRKIAVVPGRKDMSMIGVKGNGIWRPELHHSSCFAGGMLSLGSKLLQREDDMLLADRITEACAWTYESSNSGVGPESMTLYEESDPDRMMKVIGKDGKEAQKPAGHPPGKKSSDSRNHGRPETIESVFYMFRTTGDRKWQDRGWQMFTSWVEHAITDSGFAGLDDVYSETPNQVDVMESHVISETFKYYYLLFSPVDLLSLDEYVFNTQGHPFLIPTRYASSLPPTLWTGPDAASTPLNSFISTVGLGTTVQKWARVQQAAILSQARPTAPKVLGIPKGMKGFKGPKDKPIKEQSSQQKADKAVAMVGNWMDNMIEGEGGFGAAFGGVRGTRD